MTKQTDILPKIKEKYLAGISHRSTNLLIGILSYSYFHFNKTVFVIESFLYDETGKSSDEFLLKDQSGRINVLFVNQASYLPIYLYYSLLKNTIMKKIFTLLFAVGFLAAAHAQSGSRDNRDNKQYDQRVDQQNGQWDNNNGYSNGKDIARNDGRFDNNNSSFGRGIEMQIAQINRKYDFQVQRVQHDFFMRRYEKIRMINSLEAKRQWEIRMLYAKSGNRNGQYDHGYNSNHRY